MRNIELVIPKLEEYSYEEKLKKDPNTMSYNAGYDVKYSGYHYDTGCILLWISGRMLMIKE